MEVVVSATKHRLPETRAGVTHHFTIYIKDESSGVRELDGYIQTGEYEDGRLGEIFVRVGKPGSTEAWLDQWALGASLALQHGVPLEVYFAKFQGQRFEPSGATKNPDIPRCTSIIDYVARYVLRRYSTQGSP
jgi:ribonucleoside-diphosphate reductase alpha chain